MLLLAELKLIMPFAGKRAALYLDFLNQTCQEYNIISPLRQAAFLAQLAHESGSLRYVKELASGEAYEGRLDLGNTEVGDGVRYKGRGFIQITGRANYKACGDALGLDLLTHPELLEQPLQACLSAGWFWKSRGLNELADVKNFRKITKLINGGYNGYEDRLKYYNIALKVLN
jgi:putative chitinase